MKNKQFILNKFFVVLQRRLRLGDDGSFDRNDDSSGGRRLAGSFNSLTSLRHFHFCSRRVSTSTRTGNRLSGCIWFLFTKKTKSEPNSNLASLKKTKPLRIKIISGLPSNGSDLLHHHPVDVPLPDHLLRLQPQCRVLGNAGGGEEKDCRRNGTG